MHLPAVKFSLSHAHLETLLPGCRWMTFPGVSRQFVSLDAVETPGLLAGFDAQADLLSVDSEHRKLRLGQCPCGSNVCGQRGWVQNINYKTYKQCVINYIKYCFHFTINFYIIFRQYCGFRDQQISTFIYLNLMTLVEIFLHYY